MFVSWFWLTVVICTTELISSLQFHSLETTVATDTKMCQSTEQDSKAQLGTDSCRWVTSSLATAEKVHDARNGCRRSLKVIRCCANRRGIYDFLLALNSNLTSILNRSRDITPTLYLTYIQSTTYFH